MNTTVQTALTRAIEEARTAILASTDLDSALQAATKAGEILRKAADELAKTRAILISQIQENENLTQAQLASRLDVTKSRAGQLLRVGRRARKNLD